MNDAIRGRIAELLESLGQADALLAARPRLPAFALARFAVDIDELTGKLQQHLANLVAAKAEHPSLSPQENTHA